MERYIDADRLISALGINQFSHEVEHCIEKHPEIIADVRENVHGHWVKLPGFVTPGGDPVWGCSECGKGVHVYGIEASTYGADVADHQWVSCPNCGADMREE